MTQTTTHVNACDASIWLDDAGGTLTDISGSSNAVRLNFTRDIRQMRIVGMSNYPYRVGQWKDCEIELRVIYSTADDEALDLLQEMWATEPDSARSMRVYLPDTGAGSDRFSGEVILASFQIPGDAQEPGPIPAEATLIPRGRWRLTLAGETFYLLKEDGDALLLETGDHILKEDAV